MINDVMGDVRARILKHFPERQIYLRSGGEVTYFVLRTRLQLAVTGLLAFMALWCVYTMANLLWGHNPLRTPGQEAKRVEAHYQRLLADAQAKEENAQLMLAEQRNSFEAIAKSLEEKHATISQIMGSGTAPIAADAPVLEYASNRVLMAPSARDPEPRVSRRKKMSSAAAFTGMAFDNSLNSLGDTQNEILMSAEAETLEKIERKRAVIEATQMDVDTVLQESGFGKGGPFIPLDGKLIETNENGFVSRVASIQARVAEVDALNQAVRALPLGHPVGVETYQTSTFGVRKDPFTKRPTFHEGVDYGGQRMTPIVATAPGTVSYVGRKGGYGRVVEIDHGHGFVTRYAHMHKTLVKRGQAVDKGEKIGGMGSTGRSTATHLHYEVHFQGRVYDPAKFLKAGLYVQ